MGPKPTATLPKVAVKTHAGKAGAVSGGGPKVGATDKLPIIATPQKKIAITSSGTIATTAATSEQSLSAPLTDISTDVPTTGLPVQGATNTTDSTTAIRITPKGPAKPISSKPNGEVTLIYEQYNELFPIENGSTTHAAIDDVYCLSFVMEGCLIHVSTHAPTVKRDMEIAKKPYDDIYMYEDPRGTYHGLEAGATYYVYVEQETEALKRDQEAMKKKASTMEGGGKVEKDEYGNVLDGKGRVLESCSCKYGNPCSDAMYCDDWDNRCAVATKNGWKGF